MSDFLTHTSKSDATTSFNSGHVKISEANRHTVNKNLDTKIFNGSVFSGLAFAAVLAFMNLGAPTASNQNSLISVKQVSSPYINRNKGKDRIDEHDSDNNVIQQSQKLQAYFGFKTAQWAKILKVERKTIYNWRNHTDTRVKNSSAQRIIVLTDFAKSFKAEHFKFFSKFTFGRNADKNLIDALSREPLDINSLLDAYYSIYSRLDGMVKRNNLLG
ncbi:hypothetical protein [Nissabacter archeti]|uniref:hypothetical protein n=1 Tax=Nissabacter archeti TaxID=1917880 RepID=UPI001115438D|nr:hypothetical protein [Nissabacter archeti]